MRECLHCGGPVESRFRYCPWCAAPQRLKLTEFFRAHPAIEHEPGRALRVSHYLEAPSQLAHVRFSVWSETGEAEAAVSLDVAEADRLARFLSDPDLLPERRRRRSLALRRR